MYDNAPSQLSKETYEYVNKMNFKGTSFDKVNNLFTPSLKTRKTY